ncbi:MAG: hypothetical protein ACTSQ7_12060 [Alphaproteobacteria bacterium]
MTDIVTDSPSAEVRLLAGFGAGAAIENASHRIPFTGARIHYFPKYREDVGRLLGSIEMI